MSETNRREAALELASIFQATPPMRLLALANERREELIQLMGEEKYKDFAMRCGMVVMEATKVRSKPMKEQVRVGMLRDGFARELRRLAGES
jgi:hypothetical protein